jgi:hypothetical protein
MLFAAAAAALPCLSQAVFLSSPQSVPLPCHGSSSADAVFLNTPACPPSKRPLWFREQRHMVCIKPAHSQLCAAVNGAQQQDHPVRPGQVCGRWQLEGVGRRLPPAQHILWHSVDTTGKAVGVSRTDKLVHRGKPFLSGAISHRFSEPRPKSTGPVTQCDPGRPRRSTMGEAVGTTTPTVVPLGLTKGLH